MNVGIEEARGQLLVNLHADDYFIDSEVLNDVESAFQVTDCRWMYGRIDILTGGNAVSSQLLTEAAFSPRRYRARGASIPHPATFVETSLLRACGGFDEMLRYAMDIDLWLRLLRVCDPGLIDRALTVFRIHAGSASSANRSAARLEEWRVRTRYAKDDWIAALLMHPRMAREVVRTALDRGRLNAALRSTH
jgi:hypothetical protein